MSESIQQLANLSSEIHPDILDGIAKDLLSEKKKISLSQRGPSVTKEFQEELRALIGELGKTDAGLALKSIAAMSRTLSKGADTEIVWTGPRSELVPSRRTEQVLLDIISQAKENLFIVSYVFYEVDNIISQLKKALSRGVKIKFLLEAPKKMGGNVDQDGVSLVKSQLPGVDVYIWDPEARSEEGLQYASVHAKCAVADNSVCLVTSANLTDSALQRNMELGLLIRGGTIPKSLYSHLLSLVRLKKIVLK